MFRLPDILREEFEARIEYKQFISPEETYNRLLPYLVEDNGYNKFAMQMFIGRVDNENHTMFNEFLRDKFYYRQLNKYLLSDLRAIYRSMGIVIPHYKQYLEDITNKRWVLWYHILPEEIKVHNRDTCILMQLISHYIYTIFYNDDKDKLKSIMETDEIKTYPLIHGKPKNIVQLCEEVDEEYEHMRSTALKESEETIFKWENERGNIYPILRALLTPNIQNEMLNILNIIGPEIRKSKDKRVLELHYLERLVNRNIIYKGNFMEFVDSLIEEVGNEDISNIFHYANRTTYYPNYEKGIHILSSPYLVEDREYDLMIKRVLTKYFALLEIKVRKY